MLFRVQWELAVPTTCSACPKGRGASGWGWGASFLFSHYPPLFSKPWIENIFSINPIYIILVWGHFFVIRSRNDIVKRCNLRGKCVQEFEESIGCASECFIRQPAHLFIFGFGICPSDKHSAPPFGKWYSEPVELLRDRRTWKTIGTVLSTHRYSTVTMKDDKQNIYHICTASTTDPLHLKIYEVLHVKNPLKRKRFIVSQRLFALTFPAFPYPSVLFGLIWGKWGYGYAKAP